MDRPADAVLARAVWKGTPDAAHLVLELHGMAVLGKPKGKGLTYQRVGHSFKKAAQTAISMLATQGGTGTVNSGFTHYPHHLTLDSQ